MVTPLEIDPKPLVRHFLNYPPPTEAEDNPARCPHVYLQETIASIDAEIADIQYIKSHGMADSSIEAPLNHDLAHLQELRGQAHSLAMEMSSFSGQDGKGKKEQLATIQALAGKIFNKYDRRARHLGYMKAAAQPAAAIGGAIDVSLASMAVPIGYPALAQAQAYNGLMHYQTQDIELGLAQFGAYLRSGGDKSFMGEKYKQMVGEELVTLVALSERLMPGNQQAQALKQMHVALAEAVQSRDIDNISHQLGELKQPLLEFRQALESIAAMFPALQETGALPEGVRASVFNSTEEREEGLQAAHSEICDRFGQMAKTLGIQTQQNADRNSGGHPLPPLRPVVHT